MASTDNTPPGEKKEYTVFEYDNKNKVNIEHKIITKKTGEIGGTGDNKYCMSFYEDTKEKQISPWHDIPLKTGQKEGIYNFICEIPKNTKPKMEINTKGNFNPIEQDIKDEKPREYHGPIHWNYGCLPQTWENPDKIDDELNHKGDNDPLDVVEIGDGAMEIGEIAPVKVLGILAMIDEGEVDWKVIAIRTNATLKIGEEEKSANDIDEVPGKVFAEIREWFRSYKTLDGKPLNKFGLNGELQDKQYAIKIIKDTNEEYNNLLKNGVKHYTDKAQDLKLSSGNQKGGMRKRRKSRRTKRKRKSLNKNKRTKRKRNTSKKSRRTRTRTRRR